VAVHTPGCAPLATGVIKILRLSGVSPQCTKLPRLKYNYTPTNKSARIKCNFPGNCILFVQKLHLCIHKICLDMESLKVYYYKLLRETSTDFQRYCFDKINWKARMIGLTGARGVGKTTLVLQRIKLELPVEETLYATADDFYFANHTLLNLADEFEKQGGKTLFIDEIHKYKEWSRELKMIYDYHPKLKIVFTGSSILDINRGAADLSRRAVMYQMQELKATYDIFSSPVSDFQTSDMTFDVGGKSKTRKQIKDIENGFVVKDNAVMIAKFKQLIVFFYDYLSKFCYIYGMIFSWITQ
jgi:hypothetical protein